MQKDIRAKDNPLQIYHIRIHQVTMKVKFQCRMKIDFNSEPITLEVPHSGFDVYVFNHDVTLCEDSLSDNCFTLAIGLVTSKGAKYIAALAYLYFGEMTNAL